MEITFWTYLIVVPLIFLSGLVDSIAGGGGLISLPAYYLAGFSPIYALGTNKCASAFGTSLSAWKYARTGNVFWPVAIFSAIGCLVGASGGTTLATVLDENILKIIVVIALPCVAIFLAFSKGLGKDGSQMKDYPPVKVAVISLIIGLLIGFYDGLIGPGTGTFLILLFCGILGMDMLKAGGCAKIANLASNVASVLVVLRGGQIVYAVAIPAMAAAMAGNWVGSRIAIKGGAKRIRSVIYVVLALLFVRIIGDLLGFSVSDLAKLFH